MNNVRILTFSALALGVCGALIGTLEVHAAIDSTISLLHAYAALQMAACAAAIILVFRTFKAEIRGDSANWHRPILRAAPRWAKIVCAVGVIGSLAYFASLVGVGVSVSDWSGAAPQERGAIFLGFSIFNYLAFLGLSAVAEHAA